MIGIATDEVESRSVYIVFSYQRFLNNVMREGTRGKLTISMYIHLLETNLYQCLGKDFPPTPSRLHIEFGFDQPSGFGEDA